MWAERLSYKNGQQMALHPWLLLLDLILVLFLVFGTRVCFGADSGQSTMAPKDEEKEKSDQAKEFCLHIVGMSCLEKLAGAEKDPFVLV